MSLKVTSYVCNAVLMRTIQSVCLILIVDALDLVIWEYGDVMEYSTELYF